MTHIIINPKKKIVLAGADHDECDESVVCHEYAHWIFSNQGKYRFLGVRHNSQGEVDARLSYSEGIATFFAQAFLNSDNYLDGN